MNNENSNKFQPKGKTKLVKGSILAPENAGLRLVLNVANLAGKAESPLYPLFDKKWKKVKEEVKGWYNTRTGAYKLGATSNVAVQSDTWVINLLCQNDQLETDVNSLKTCLKSVANLAKEHKASVHVSTLLTNLIPELASLLNDHLISNGVSVYFYEEA
jgi:hypothetical protein